MDLTAASVHPSSEDYTNDRMSLCQMQIFPTECNLAEFDPKEDLAFLSEAIINSRTNSNGDPEVLVKWEKDNLEEATWENLNSLKLQFPDLDYIGDNVNSDGERDATAQQGQSPSPQHQTARIKARPTREVKKPMRYMD
ncbi:hypothetical protein CTI12_AA265830 [Artemisia annua]|uniref:Chromo domain-containing protein n=1 Tax=Artemisia annua TaxID=35608 RepID=A0A2U1NHF8_ARTAN|nr:hypothetical protein CTI12_AA265830 [Artemisia annua]